MIDPRVAAAFERDNGFALETHLLVLAPNGVASAGIEQLGFVIPPIGFHLGLSRWQYWAKQVDELSIVIHSLEMAVRLLLKGNPGIASILWLDDPEYLYRHPLLDLLRDQRAIFSSQAAVVSFTLLARHQLTRIEAAEDFANYAVARRETVHRYDVQSAARLIRILRMGLAFLESGSLRVPRAGDADETTPIARGDWSFERVKAEAERLFIAVDVARSRSTLPARPDHAAANVVLMEVHRRMLGLTTS